MRLTLDSPGTQHLIRSYSDGEIRIGERRLHGSLIVSASTLIADWGPRRIEELTRADLEPALALAPEVLLIGTGPQHCLPGRPLLADLYAARVGFEIMHTGAACRTFNVLLGEGRRVAAALIL